MCAEILYREEFTWDVAFLFTLSRTYFAALAVFHSFLALKERRTQDLTKTLYMARRRRRTLFFTVTEGAEVYKGPLEARSWHIGVFFGCWLQSHMSRGSSALAHKSQMDQNDSRSHLQLMMCISRLIQLVDRFPCPRNVFGRA